MTLLVALLLAADPLGDGVARYGDLDYEGCVGALAPAVGKLRGGARAKGELYLGLCLFALGREGEARRHLDVALRIDGGLNPPPNASPKEKGLFDDVARAVAANPSKPKRPSAPRKPDEPEPPPDPEPEPQLQPEPQPEAMPMPMPAVETPPPPPRTYRAATVLTLLTVAAAGTAVGFGIVTLQTAGEANREPVQVPSGAQLDRANTFALVTNLGIATASALAVTAFIAWLWSAL